MATVPVIISGVFYPKGKAAGDKPMAGTMVGNAAIAGLEVGGGPILPPDQVPPVDPPLEIWGGPIDPYPDHGLPLPQPPIPPINPPSTSEPVKKNAWNWNDGKNPQYPNTGWYYVYVPSEGEAGPKRR